MSVEVATLERVRAAESALRTEGSKVTADAVLAHIGGGSKQTVLKHLKALRADPEMQTDVPHSVIDMALPVLAGIFHAGEKAEAERNRGQSDRLSRMMDDLECQIDELAGENSELLADLEASRTRFVELSKTHALKMEELVAANAEVKRLEKELQRERDDASKRLAKFMAQFEASMSALGTGSAK